MRAFGRSLFLLIVAGAFAGSFMVVGAQDEKKAEYVGAEGCLCHADPVHKSWQLSKHARAFELLKLAGQEKNEKCLACHTTGYGQGGYGTAGVEANLEGVQCEECHGPAGDHVEKMDKDLITRTPSAMVCARCHMEKSIHARP
ncbi:MAG: hypothetical protein FJX74_03095 [Armatimonadetes bacterium]|nr:hypothetical protein [Armatimonadota bacterium]